MKKPMGDEVRAMVRRLKRWSAAEMEQRSDSQEALDGKGELTERPNGGFLLPSVIVA